MDKKNTQQPKLMVIENNFGADIFSSDTKKGYVSEVIFNDIYIIADEKVEMPESNFTGTDETHRIDGVVIKNLYFNGKKVQCLIDAKISFNEFCEVEFN